MNYQDYRFICGLDTEEVVSKHQIKRKVKRLAEDRGYKTKGFARMNKKQLKAIMRKLSR